MDESKQAPSTSGQPPQPPPAFEPPPVPHPLRAVFIGPDGLRVPWRLLLYLAFAFVFVSLLGTVHHFWHPRNRLWDGLIAELQIFTSAVAAAFLMARLEKRPFDAYGLPRREAFRKPFWIGIAWGVGSLSVLMLVMRAGGLFYFGGLALHGTRMVKFAVFYALFFVLVGLAEEFVSRGYIQFTLAQGIGFWPAAALLSALFGATHVNNPGETPTGILGAAVIGFFFCLTLRRTGNLWFAIGFHASWDWGETYFYSVPDSGGVWPGHLLQSSFQGPTWLTGGSVGPEGSALLFVVIALTWVVFDRAYPEVKYPE
jgi:membrane protease YdiL (CAAX protease family)